LSLLRPSRVLAPVLAPVLAFLGPTPGLALDRAPPAICAAKLAQVKAGESADLSADVEWLSNYCDAATRDAAVNAIGEAAMNAGINDTVAASQDAARQARSGIAAAHHDASADSAPALVGIAQDGLAAMATPPPPTVVVVVPRRGHVP
jgi:hypothetical protein